MADTPEPDNDASLSSGKEPIYVVQKHDDSHLQWEFRLEAEGVLKSWAVPKGPSKNPDDKRLAVQVEDHPLDYARFEGVIPEGNYGAGTVEIWDNGTISSIEKYREITAAIHHGGLEFKLHGRKLKRLYTLVPPRCDGKDKNWLLIKKEGERSLIPI